MTNVKLAFLSDKYAMLILCPYCLSVIYDQTVICPFCQQDTRNDAKWELSAAEFVAEAHKDCVHCAAALLEAATYCPICAKPQDAAL